MRYAPPPEGYPDERLAAWNETVGEFNLFVDARCRADGLCKWEKRAQPLPGYDDHVRVGPLCSLHEMLEHPATIRAMVARRLGRDFYLASEPVYKG